jgi:predicted nucleic acid-binding protein
MNSIYIDSNIYLNLFFREVDPKTGLELWRGSKPIFDHIIDKEVDAYSSLTAIMEIIHAFRLKGVEPDSVIEDCMCLGVHIVPPDSWVMIRALQFQIENKLDPYDAVALSVAVECKCNHLVTRDNTFIKRISDIIPAAEPESIIEKLLF